MLLRKPLQRVVVTRDGKFPGTSWFTSISLKKIKRETENVEAAA